MQIFKTKLYQISAYRLPKLKKLHIVFIGDEVITGDDLYGGSGNDIFLADADTGIQLGNATFASAPFSVSPVLSPETFSL